ncbi:hypothetical protein [Streptomyces sp. NPDC020917]|uniref:hypothetical protein n=1 Tax=Streptomyces sp. NPDC020917 TaxID=3365102 RepID=UPI0037A18AD9
MSDTTARLLPWSSAEGKPTYLVTGQEGDSPLSRIADQVEADLTANAEHVLNLSGRPEMADADLFEMRFVVRQLRASLRDVLTISESRGQRLSG